MAFKTREQRAAMKAKETPYTITDHLYFRDKNMRRGTIDISMDSNSVAGGLSDRSYRATVERNGKTEAIHVVFLGQRAKDFGEGAVIEDMERERQEMLNRGNYDFEKITRSIIAEGFWKPRKWKDHSGNWHKAWQFYAAKWHYQLPNGSIVEEGAMPQA